MELFPGNNGQHGSPEIKAQIFNKIVKVMHLSTSDTLLDVGSGDGYYSSKFAEVCGNVIAIDQLFFSNSFHDMRCQDAILKSFSNKLTNGAYLTMIEFKLDTLFGPPKSIRLSKEELKAKVESYGFIEEASIDLTTHYFISFKLVK